MAKRTKRSTRPKQRSDRRRPRQRREPDLVEQIADALDTGEPLALLELASGFLDAVDPRSDHSIHPDPHRHMQEEFLESLFAAPLPETSALLAAVAALVGDDMLRRRVAHEIADRGDVLPGWLAELPKTVGDPDAVEVTEPFGDAADVMASVTLPGGHSLVAVVLVEHNLGSIVKDAFVVPGPVDELVAALAGADDAPDLVVGSLSAADAKARIAGAIDRGARTVPPIETGTWPGQRPLVEWIVGLLPDGGSGYEFREWTDEEVDDLARRFRASPFAEGVDDPGDMLSSLLRFGSGDGPGDPLRWSPTAVEILLLDWIPRKLMVDAGLLADVPDVLRALIRFCHHERGIRPGLTDDHRDRRRARAGVPGADPVGVARRAGRVRGRSRRTDRRCRDRARHAP